MTFLIINERFSFINRDNHSFISVRMGSEKHLLVSRFVTSVRSSSRLSVCISSFPINVFSRNMILRTSRMCAERLQIWLKSGKKYISLLHGNNYVDSSKKGNPFLRLYDKGLTVLYCLQLRVNNNTKEIILAFPLLEIFPQTRHLFTLYVCWPSCL